MSSRRRKVVDHPETIYLAQGLADRTENLRASVGLCNDAGDWMALPRKFEHPQDGPGQGIAHWSPFDFPSDKPVQLHVVRGEKIRKDDAYMFKGYGAETGRSYMPSLARPIPARWEQLQNSHRKIPNTGI